MPENNDDPVGEAVECARSLGNSLRRVLVTWSIAYATCSPLLAVVQRYAGPDHSRWWGIPIGVAALIVLAVLDPYARRREHD